MKVLVYKPDGARVRTEMSSESITIGQIGALLEPLAFDARWRIINYLCIMYLNRSWALAHPKERA